MESWNQARIRVAGPAWVAIHRDQDQAGNHGAERNPSSTHSTGRKHDVIRHRIW
jgi:hypothetical protein